jgi:DNA polymerase-3 subunit delta
MRLKGKEIDRFVASPDPSLPVILIYGPDEGLVRERSTMIAQKNLSDPDDPFALLDLNEDEFKADPARLSDEFGAVSMFGGKRVIRLRFKTDRYGKHIKELLSTISDGSLKGDATIIIEAGDLKVTSALRKACEGAKNAVALPCYRDEGFGLKNLVKDTLRQENIRATEDILDLLVSELGNDRAITRKELEKLVLYKQADTSNANDLTLNDIEQAIASANTLGLQDVAYSTASGDLQTLTKSLERCFLQNEQPIAIIRSLVRHMEQLHLVLCYMEQGENARSAMDKLKPRIHFSRKASFEKQMRLWTKARCEHALSILLQSETDCKTTGMPTESICAQIMMRLARAAGTSAHQR